MISVKPVNEVEVIAARALYKLPDEVDDLLQRLWECNRDQAAHILQMNLTWMEAKEIVAKSKKQAALF